MSHLACVAGCAATHDVMKPLFACPSCGGLLDVVHDETAWRTRSAAGWHRLLAERAASSYPLDRSGVWAHREWVMPDLPERDVVTAGEGRAPMTAAEACARRLGLRRVLVKQCGHSLTGSFKDLGMTVLVSMARAMRRNGEDIRALICASTGDTSAALAAYGALAQLPVVVLLPRDKVSKAQLVQPLAHGAHVLALDGDFDACMKVVQAISERPGMFLANSKNPLRLEGQKTVAFEIAWDLGWAVPDAVLLPSGNLGNISALERGFQSLVDLGLLERVPLLVACQVTAADPLYRASLQEFSTLTPVIAGETRATAIRIGDPVSWPRAQRALLRSSGMVVSVTEEELLKAELSGDRDGLFVDPHTAVALAALTKLVEQGRIAQDGTCVVVSTAHGLKFTDQKAEFHFAQEAGEASGAWGRLRNPPVVLDADVVSVERELKRRLESPR